MNSINQRLDPSTVQTSGSVLDNNPRAGREEQQAHEHGPPASPDDWAVEHQDRAYIQKIYRNGRREVLHAGTPQSCKGALRILRKRMAEIVAHESRSCRNSDEEELFSFTLDNGVTIQIVGGLSNAYRQWIPEDPTKGVITEWAVRHRWDPCPGKAEELATADLGESVILRRVDDDRTRRTKVYRVT